MLSELTFFSKSSFLRQKTVAGARAINACASLDHHPISRVRNERGQMPEWFPAKLGKLRDPGRAAVRNTTELLQFYNLATTGVVRKKIKRLSRHIGVRQ